MASGFRKPHWDIAYVNVVCFITIISIACGWGGAVSFTNWSISVKDLCGFTPYPNACRPTLSAQLKTISPNDNQLYHLYDSKLLYNISVAASMAEISRVLDYFKLNTTRKDAGSFNMSSALECCTESLSLALDNLNDSLLYSSHDVVNSKGGRYALDDYRTWISAADADVQTCLDGFDDAPDDVRRDVVGRLKFNSSVLIGNSLAIATRISDHYKINRKPARAKEATPHNWLSANHVKLAKEWRMMPNVTVAKDGSGNYSRISDAVAAAPEKNWKRFIIYVKRGIYDEIVKVGKGKMNIVMYGDGMFDTIVTGNLSNVMGYKTFHTATFSVSGRGFIAQDMGFRNTAGAVGKQAVALLSTSDLSVFYRCSVDGFQDTLYPHSNRQFYRECSIHGTVDFIFGRAAAVFQNCTIFVKKPRPGQVNTIIAQGKMELDAVSGFSIQQSMILPADNLNGVRTFLGRPWKNYSTTILMDTYLDGFIHPQGWLPWDNSPVPDTIRYVEYRNAGPGARVSDRVRWRGLRTANSSNDDVCNFTVKSFIDGDLWLPATRVPFDLYG